MLAKMCTDVHKPNGQFYLAPTREAILAFMSETAVRKVPSVGPKTAYTLNGLGINTCADILNSKLKINFAWKGDGYSWLIQAALGIGSTQHGEKQKRKNISRSQTFQPIADPKKFSELLYEFAEEIESDLQRLKAHAITINVHFRTRNFESMSKAKSLQNYTNQASMIYEQGMQLFDKIWDQKAHLRLLGLGVSNLTYNLGRTITSMMTKQ
jgi:DNA polymerase kappa